MPSVTGRGSCAAFSRFRALCGFVPHLQGEAYGYGCSNGSFQDLGFQLHPNYTLRLTTHTNTLQNTLSRKALYPGLGFRVVVFGALNMRSFELQARVVRGFRCFICRKVS